MKKALVIGHTGGIGSAISTQLHGAGYRVTGVSRSEGGLDFADLAGADKVLAAIDGPFDLVFVATGVLTGAGVVPEKTIRALDPAAMEAQFRINAIGPALVLKHAVRWLPKDTPSHLAVLSARVGSISDNRLGGWISYRSAKAALNQAVRTSAIEFSRTHRHATVVAMHPGTVATSFTQEFQNKYKTISPQVSAAGLVGTLLNTLPDQTGTFWDWNGKPVPW